MTVAVAVALMLAIAGFIYALYSGSAPDGSDKKLKADSALLAAIPSDAAAVMTFQELSKGMPVLSHFCSGPFKDYVQEIVDAGSLSGVSVAASLHYSGNLVPLLVVSKADSALYRTAVASGLAAQFVPYNDREFMLVSPSETARSGREHRIPLMAPARHPVLPCLSVHVRTAEAPILSAAVRHRGSPARTVHARRPEITREAKDNTTAVSGRMVPEPEHSAHPEADPDWVEANCC